MKKVTAYVNTMRVHWLVEELESVGVQEIMVTEYFSPLARISRFVFLCSDDSVKQVCDIVHRVGTNGYPEDHYIDIRDYQPRPIDMSSLGQRLSRLEE